MTGKWWRHDVVAQYVFDRSTAALVGIVTMDIAPSLGLF